MSPSATALSSTSIVLEFFSCSFFSSAATSSSVTSAADTSTSTPLYSPKVTSGFTATSAVKMKDFPFSICTMSIVGLETMSNSLSCAAFGYSVLIRRFAASSKNTPTPYIFSIITRGAFPLRNPGMLMLFLFLL